MEKVICNPLDLEYRYQYRTSRDGSYSVAREAADPTMVLFKGTYYLFASMSGGFWYSDDLHTWQFKQTPELPIYDYAPDVREVDGKILFSASRRGEPCSFYTSKNPLTQPFEMVSTLFDFWDPDIFVDDDGKVYFYWGCTNSEPIWGIEIDAKTLMPIGEKIALFGEDEANHGWERKGENNVIGEPKTEMERMIRQYVGTKPFIEGAYMNKYNGKYYLQYAAPGTECNVYADGVYIAENPLGPYTYQAHNPFSSKPGGFITSAGHGSTFQDKRGNWWHVSTMRISQNENFERRIGLFPCDFDEDGVLYCNQHFADYPYALPQGIRPKEQMTAFAPSSNLLSYKKQVTVSSSQSGFEAEFAADENIRTWWAAREDDNNPWLQINLGSVCKACAIQINFADHLIPAPAVAPEPMPKDSMGARHIYVTPQRTAYVVEYSTDGETWQEVLNTHAENTDYAHRLWVSETEIEMQYIRIRNIKTPFNGVCAISGLRVFGTCQMDKPSKTQNIKVKRSEDEINIVLNWDTVENADGYNVRYGIAKDKLYNSWQVNSVNELDLSMVNSKTKYYIAIDSFNAGGVTAGDVFCVE